MASVRQAQRNACASQPGGGLGVLVDTDTAGPGPAKVVACLTLRHQNALQFLDSRARQASRNSSDAASMIASTSSRYAR